MTTKLINKLLDYPLNLLDQFKLDCTDEELKTDKDAKKCFKKLNLLRIYTKVFLDYLKKLEVW